ncbi:MAG: hypothetical protein K8823_755 [Cenarchaeum symbiont of Oopsacas minuta]|nr:hypothetical protein [Cenarchaeum symbiont of Oopsacas minuta]
MIAESKGLIAHDFRVFFMGHTGSIEATYTTNKTMLPEDLIDAMRDSFKRAEKYLDIETMQKDKTAETKEKVHTHIQNAKPNELEAILEALERLNAGKMLQASV